jgi:hypothetical protein
MPPVLPPTTAAPFHMASATVSPNPSRIAFCITTAAFLCKAFTSAVSWVLMMMIRSSRSFNSDA